jgi:hypothetical protein
LSTAATAGFGVPPLVAGPTDTQPLVGGVHQLSLLAAGGAPWGNQSGNAEEVKFGDQVPDCLGGTGGP